MSILVSKTKEQIKDCIVSAAKKAIAENLLPESELADFTIETPANRDHGDYAVNAAMVWAKGFRKAPRQIAEILMQCEDFDATYVDKYEIAGPGFINIFLKNEYFADILTDIYEKGADYGKSDLAKAKRFLSNLFLQTQQVLCI